MGFFFNEPDRKYAVINFKDKEGLIFKAVRCDINEILVPPTVATNKEGIVDPETYDKEYVFTGKWVDSNNQVVTQVIASGAYDYYADICKLKLYSTAVMETEVDNTQHMMSNVPFRIYSNKQIYLETTNYQGYSIESSVIHTRDISGDVVNRISFQVIGLKDIPGQTSIFYPEFKVYKNSELTDEIGTIKIDLLIVHSTKQPTGD